MDYLPLEVANLKEAAHGADGSAGGLDGLPTQLAELLAPGAWELLRQLLELCEEEVCWPQQACAWRIAYLPKEGADKGYTRIDKVRPPSSMQTWWRAAISTFKPEAKVATAARRCCGPSTLRVQGRPFPFAASLDFATAYDSAEPRIAARLLRRWGLPQRICKLLLAQWENTVRWAAFFFWGGGAFHPVPNAAARALLQGNPWAPHALAAILGPPHQSRIPPTPPLPTPVP
mmetsp:Transcript_3408/g.9247  ORF Transcript_3408/g.9247 Transcript_3408/m.9247 type:complete len:231 (+) Transcript_3408:293-985(+)